MPSNQKDAWILLQSSERGAANHLLLCGMTTICASFANLNVSYSPAKPITVWSVKVYVPYYSVYHSSLILSVRPPSGYPRMELVVVIQWTVSDFKWIFSDLKWTVTDFDQSESFIRVFFVNCIK
jgi:hypothetical protein